MIAGIFHEGSGLGNQLHRYVMSRVLAEDKAYEHGMVNSQLFKGKSFMNLDCGKPWPFPKYSLTKVWQEKKVVENGVDIRGYDPEMNFVPDDTIIDGEFQDERYFEHRMSDINKWLAVEPMRLELDVCAIGFRGGEYSIYPDLFLKKEWWSNAIHEMKLIQPHVQFEVHTDDPVTAREFFPLFPIVHDIGVNWRTIRYARYSIIANSSFYIFPRLLAQHTIKGAVTLAPRYWARHNTGVWALPQNYYKSFTYL
jgi:hypothetical protein